MFKVDTCCCGYSLEAGGILIGVYTFITSLLAILVRIFAWTNTNVRDLYCPDLIPELCYEENAWTKIFSVIWFFSHVIALITAYFLINGIPEKNPYCVKPFIIANLAQMVINMLLILAYGMGTKYIILTFIMSGVFMYFIFALIALEKTFDSSSSYNV